MKWLQPKRLRSKTAERKHGDRESLGASDRPRALRAASLCVASGKGGTGKSVVSASLGHALGQVGRTLLVDADLGVGNAHILQDVSPAASFVDLVEGRREIAEVVHPCGDGLDLIAGGCGVSRMSELNACEAHLLAAGLEELERDYRYVLVDSAAGISRQTLSFAVAADVVLLVTTPDLTAMTDVYAFIKVLLARRPTCEPLLVVNRAADEEQAIGVSERIERVARRFLGRVPRTVGWLPDDPAVTASVNRRAPVVVSEPESPWAKSAGNLAAGLLTELDGCAPRGLGRSMLAERVRSVRPA